MINRMQIKKHYSEGIGAVALLSSLNLKTVAG
jgi:hypothetical protein